MLKNPFWHWSEKEETTFAEMVEKYGMNYKLIKANIPTRTFKGVKSHGYQLRRKIEINPKHRHSALKQKLKPIRTHLRWTAKEFKLLLKGLKKHVHCWDWVKKTSVLFEDRTIT